MHDGAIPDSVALIDGDKTRASRCPGSATSDGRSHQYDREEASKRLVALMAVAAAVSRRGGFRGGFVPAGVSVRARFSRFVRARPVSSLFEESPVGEPFFSPTVPSDRGLDHVPFINTSRKETRS